MRCNKKQWISILLIAAMCFTMIPSVAFAETGTDEKTVLPKEEYVSVTYCEAPAVSLFALDSNGSVALKDGQYEQWIDRLDLTGNDYAEDFYSWMETTDAVITPESAEQLTSGEYVHRVTSFSGTGSFAYTGEYEKDVAAIEEVTREELDVHMMEAFAYIDAAFSAFSRDHAEVFWLNNTIKVMSECSYAYDSTGTVKYTQDIYFVLKSADFDIRVEEYRSAENIQSVIEQRDVAVDEITAAATGSRYEKVAYFNEWLTTHNSYNFNVATAGRAAHECISALSGSTGANGPVCEGYASAMKVLCDAAGIPCVLVDGIADNMSGNPEGHMWNYVQMENGKWYAVDVTWNDPSTGSSAALSGAEHTGYLLIGSETVVNDNGMTFVDTHTLRNIVTENGTAFTNGPILEKEAYEYDANVGENEDNSNIVAIGECGDNVTWTLDTNGLLAINGTGEMANYRKDMVTVPWLDYKEDIKNVIVENGVTSIGDYAFEGCSNLAEITLPEGITAIGDYAFGNCDTLVDITIPDGVTRLGDYAFFGADGLKNLIVPASVSNIGSDAFSACTNLEIVRAKGNLDIIAERAFSGCSNLKNISIEGTVGGIAAYAFRDCANLEKISARTITGAIGSDAFNGCSALRKLDASLDGITTIDRNAFENCISLAELVLPKSLIRINDYAFRHCGLEEIIIPESVTRIGGHAFEACYKLKNVVLSSNATDYAEIGIAANLFYDCSYLQTVTIANDMIKVIAENAFGKCTGLTDIYFAGSPNQWNFITVEDGNEALTSNSVTIHCETSDDEILASGNWGINGSWQLTRGGVLDISGFNETIDGTKEWNTYAEFITTVRIYDGVKGITGMLYNCINLTDIYIPDSVTSIGNRTFYYCDNLTIYGYTNSYAETYANEKNIPFVAVDDSEETIKTISMHRLYNPNSGEHFYTGSIEERDNLVRAGWQYEGVAWNAPINTGEPVYRLFNPNNGDHHYTMSLEERDMLVSVGWQYEGVAWNSAGNDGIPLYRLYNPNADCGSHHYTGSEEERDMLISVGWIYEGIGWFGIR